MSGSSNQSAAGLPDSGTRPADVSGAYDTESSTERSELERRGAPAPSADVAPARRLSRCELDLGLDVIEEDGGCRGRRHSDADLVQLDALHYRLSLYLNDQELAAARREVLRPGRSRRQVSRRNSELTVRPTGVDAAVCRRHSELVTCASSRRASRRPSRRPASRAASRLGSRAGSCVGSTRRLHSEEGPATDADLLPSCELEIKERRRRQVVLAVMAGAFIIVTMSVGLIFVMLYLTSSEGSTDEITVRKENEEIYGGMKSSVNQTTTASTIGGAG